MLPDIPGVQNNCGSSRDKEPTMTIILGDPVHDRCITIASVYTLHNQTRAYQVEAVFSTVEPKS